MNQKFIQSTLLGSILIGVLTFGNFSANATGFKTPVTNNGQAITANQFYGLLNKTAPTEVAKTFGMPDKISSLNGAEGNLEGVIWTYEDAVAEKNEKLDANLVFIHGEFKYVTLSNSK